MVGRNYGEATPVCPAPSPYAADLSDTELHSSVKTKNGLL